MFAAEIVDKILEVNNNCLATIGKELKLYAPINGTVIDIIDGRLGEENILYNLIKYNSKEHEILFLSINSGEARGDNQSYLIVEMNSKGFVFAVKHELYNENIQDFCKCFWSIKNAARELKYDWEFTEFMKCYSINSYIPIRILSKPFKGACLVSLCSIDGKFYDKNDNYYDRDAFRPTARLYLDFKKDSDVAILVDDTIQAYLTKIDTEKKFLRFELRPRQLNIQNQLDKSSEEEPLEKEIHVSSGKSPFAYFPGEVVNDVSIIKSPMNIAFDIRQGYINDEALVICKVVSYFGFMTSKLLSFALKNLDPSTFSLVGRYERAYVALKNNAESAQSLQKHIIGKMVNTYGLLDAHRFVNINDRNPSTLILSISRNGLALLKSKELISELEAYDNAKDSQEAEKLKRKLATVQLLLMQLAFYKGKTIKYLKETTILAGVAGYSNKHKARPSFILYFNNNCVIYEVIRRGPEGHSQKVQDKLERIGLISKFYDCVTNKGALVFNQKPKLVFICEDADHILEINEIVKNHSLIDEDFELFYSHDRAIANVDPNTKEILVDKYALSHYKITASGALDLIPLENILYS